MDTDNSGAIDAEELSMCLEKGLGLQASLEETKSLVNFLDDSSDGRIQAEELDKALKIYQKFCWEKERYHQMTIGLPVQ
ncbi:unnamed protein product, partial [Chrysoparadoxa australica]